MSSPVEGSLSGAEIARQYVATSPYISHLGIQLVALQPGGATLALPFQESLATVGTVIHGGAIASLMDTAGAVAAWSDVEAPASGRGSTVNLTVSYLAPAQREDVQAIARVLRRGRQMVFLDIEVVGSTSGQLVAKGQATYKLS